MFKLLSHNRHNLVITNGKENIEIAFSMIFHLQAVGRRTKITGFRFHYTVNTNFAKMVKCLHAADFIQVNHYAIVNRHHVGAFENNCVKISFDYIDIDPAFKIKEADFPWVACKERVIQEAIKDRKINSKPLLN